MEPALSFDNNEARNHYHHNERSIEMIASLLDVLVEHFFVVHSRHALEKQCCLTFVLPRVVYLYEKGVNFELPIDVDLLNAPSGVIHSTCLCRQLNLIIT